MTRPRRLKVIVEADGGSRGNPGPAGYGAVVREAATGEVLVERAKAIGVTTNNVAEYSGLIAGLQAAADLGAVDVEARLDSKLVVEQMSGRWQIKHPGLRPLAAAAAALGHRFDNVRYVWVPRERNKHADALANAAMDGKDLPDIDISGLGSPSVESVGAVESSGPAEPADSAEYASPTKPVRAPSVSWMPPSAAVTTRLVLVRHGETELTAQRRFSGREDVALSARGVAQARATAERVAALVGRPVPVVSSPLSRCVNTAAEIAKVLGDTSVVTIPALIECDFGEWEGLRIADVREQWPERLDEWLASPAVAPPGGESFNSVTVRVRGAVSALLAEHTTNTVVVVSHVTPIKLILRDALAAGDQFLHRMFLDPAGISIVDSWGVGGVAVRTVNDTAHVAAI